MAKKTYDHLFKLLQIGDSGVGKTCLVFRFCDDAFQTSFIPTIGIDFKIRTVEVGKKRIKLQIWDTAGQERFHTITTSYYRNAHGIFLIYDITRRDSFEHIANWVRQVQANAQESVELMLIGNKTDLEELRLVPRDRGMALASQHSMPFLETSCKTGVNVEKAFMDMTLAILKKNPAAITSESAHQRVSNNIADSSSTQSSSCSC